MTKARPLTKSSTKRVTASALAEMKAANEWSNADAADVLGISEGTVRNRLADDTDDHQMTVYELARVIAAGQVPMATRILRDLVDHHVSPDCGADAPSALEAAESCARHAAALIAAGIDGIDPGEAGQLLPGLVKLQAELAGLEARFRELIASAPVRRLHA